MAKKKTEANGSENLPVLAQPRLPYHPAVKDRFGFDKSDWKALVEAIYPAAQTPESVILALSYCKARKLDPFKRCVHIVPIWDSKRRCNVDTIWPGIGELRTTAHRTKCYAGRDKTEFGPDTEKTWEGKTKGQYGKDYKITVTFPEWAQVTVYRIMNKERVAFAGPQVYWIETFGKNSGGGPNSMWETRPRGQIDKCAEAAALRATFPEEIGNEYINDEAHYPEAKRIESTVVEKGVQGLKDRLQERDDAQDTTEPTKVNEVDKDTAAEAERQKQAMAAADLAEQEAAESGVPAETEDEDKPDEPDLSGDTAGIFD